MNHELPGSQPVPPEDVRASDPEREAVVARLQEAASEGRLSLGEFSERTEAVYTASTRGELARLTADLPAVQQYHHPSPVRSAAPQRFNAILSDQSRQLAGPVPPEINVLSLAGDTKLDLREAELPAGGLTITGWVALSKLRLVVADGVRVDVEGTNVLGSSKIRVDSPPRPGPAVLVKVVNLLGDVHVFDHTTHSRRRRGIWGG